MSAEAVISLPCSDLLAKDGEPFEVLPAGVINTPLAVALRVLTAPDDLFNTWADLDGKCSAPLPVQP